MKNYLDIVSPKEAFDRGNLFDNYFWPYKYVANVKATNEREELLLKNQIFCFAAHELNLYLDIYPDNMEAIGLFNQYTEEAEKYKREYEKKYGPITVGINDDLSWKWINSPWPWERI